MSFQPALRLAAALAGVALLGGCNMLMTQAPLFTKADEAGAPGLRPGVWAQDSTDKCQVDASQPLVSWPSCANGFVVMSDGALGAYNTKDGKPVWTVSPFVMAAGEPRIIQVRLTGEDLPPQAPFAYAALRPTKTDAQGRITAVTSWAVLCGAPPPTTAKNPDGQQRYGTLHPLAGLTMDSDNNDCTTTSPAVARLAAEESRAWTPPESVNADHWVREGDH
jgi:hypothetical protein